MKTKNEYAIITPVRIPAHRDVQIKKGMSQRKCCDAFDAKKYGNVKCWETKCHECLFDYQNKKMKPLFEKWMKEQFKGQKR